MMRLIKILTLIALFTSSLAIAQDSDNKAGSFFKQTDAPTRNLSVFNYLLTYLNEPYIDLVNPISVNNDELWDDPEYSIPVGFPFEINGHAVTSLMFGASGFLLMAPTSDPDVSTVVFPFETDLIDRGVIIDASQSPISYLVEGDPGSRILKVEINNAGSFYEFQSGTQDMFINIQLWLYEGSNQIEFRFGENSIPNPDLFYDGGGAFMGVTDINDFSGDLSKAHFFSGDIDAPELFASDITIEGTPDNGAVYRLSVTMQIDVTISSVNATSFCAPNGEATALANSGIAPFTYLWSTGETTATILNLDEGTYTVTVTDNEGVSGTASVDITNVDPIDPNASATGETSQNANDGTATSNPTGGSGGFSFLWSTGGTTATITGLDPGVYTVTVTDAEGCTAEQSVIVNSFECLALTIVAQVSDARCYGSCDGIIEVIDVNGGSAPYTYEWSTGDDTDIVFDLCTGFYMVTIVDAAGCEVTDAFFVDEAEEFFANAGATSESSMDANDGTAWASPSGNFGPFTYAWSNFSTDSLVTNLAPGVYTVTVTDSNGCTAEESVEIYAFVCIGEILFTTQPISCAGVCDGSISGTVINGGIGPFTFLWSNGFNTSSIDDLCPGNYSLTISDAGQGCDIEGSKFLNAPSLLLLFVSEVIHVTDTTSGAVFISASGGTSPYTYLWTGPNGYTSTEKDITNLEPGIYTVKVTDAHGCMLMITAEVLNETVGTSSPYNLDIHIYPNPALNKVYIQSAERLDDFHVELINPDGRKIAYWNAVNTIDISSYASGIYYLKCNSGEKYFVHRLMVIR